MNNLETSKSKVMILNKWIMEKYPSIQFSCFYDDIDFMIALFFNRMLNNAHIYEIANHLNNKKSDDVLVKIIDKGTDINSKKLFYSYLNAFGIKYFDSRRSIVAKVFYYILHDRIDLGKGFKFVKCWVSDFKKTKKYVGDDVGIEQICGNFHSICDFADEKDRRILKEAVLAEMQQYVRDNLVEFPLGCDILKDKIKRTNGT
jgi:hypothetical protein